MFTQLLEEQDESKTLGKAQIYKPFVWWDSSQWYLKFIDKLEQFSSIFL